MWTSDEAIQGFDAKVTLGHSWCYTCLTMVIRAPPTVLGNILHVNMLTHPLV